jgi:multidrug efflux system outer membrane protein
VNRTIVLAAAFSAAACSFAPKYERPEAGVPKESFRFAKPGEASSVADLPWWEVFKDPTLQALIREALAANQDLALAAARVDEARANLGIARADLYPHLNAAVTGGYGQPYSDKIVQGVVGATSQTQGRYTAHLEASWEIDLWGRVRNQRDAAYADLLATEDGRNGVVLSLVSSVAQAYLELRALDLQLEISKTNTDLRRGTLDLFEKRAKGGVASDLEVNQARWDLTVTQAFIPQTEMQIWQKENQLCVLLGRPPGPIERGAALTATPLVPELPSGVPTSLLARRPDLLAAEQGIVSAGALVGVAVANRIPTLALTGAIGLDARNVPDVFTPGAVFWNVMAGLFAPIFQGGRLSSAEEAARARLTQSIAAYRKTVEVALQEVADASAGVIKLREAREFRETGVKATTAASKLALARYEGGVSSYLEVLDAQRHQFDSQLELATTVRDQLTSVVQLYRALGGGWQQQEPPPAKPAEPAPQQQPKM